MIYFAGILLLFIIGFIEVGTIPALVSPWNYSTLIPLLFVSLLIRGQHRMLWTAAIILGVLCDSVTLLPVGSFTIMLIFLAIALRWLFQRWFSNRSWLSLISLVSIGTVLLFLMQILVRFSARFMTKNDLLTVSSSEILHTLVMGLFTTITVSIFVVAGWMLIKRALFHNKNQRHYV